LQQLSNILKVAFIDLINSFYIFCKIVIRFLKDPEATKNDKFVALELLKNANIASNFVLPGCQDTGTAIVIGKRGQNVLTEGKDEEHISHGVFDTYTSKNLR